MNLRISVLSFAIGCALAASAFAAVPDAPKLVPSPTRVYRAPTARFAPVPEPKPVGVKLPALSARQIVARNVRARGGLHAWRRIHSMTMTGEMDAGRHRVDGGNFGKIRTPAEQRAQLARWRKTDFEKPKKSNVNSVIRLPFTLQLKRPLKSRLEIQFAGATAVQVYDGTNGWKLRPYLGRHEVEPFTPTEKKIAALAQPLDGPLIDYKAKGTKVAVMGGEKVDGHDAYKLELTLKNGSVRHVWVDAKTFLDIKIDGVEQKVNGRLRREATYLADYRRVNGVMVPYLYETKIEGLPDTDRIQIDKVQLNEQIADARFAEPQ